MNHRMTVRIAALFLALLMLTGLAACAKDEPESVGTADTQPAAPGTESTEAPGEEEVILTGESTEPTQQPQPGPEPESDPKPEQGSDPELQAENPLPDGTYPVKLECTQTLDRNGTLWAGFVLLHYVELPNDQVSSLKAGDTVQLPEYSFVIENVRQDDSMGYREIWFNDGTEHCIYMEDTDCWRFTWPDDEPYYTDGEHSIMPLAVDAILTDELTPLSEGRNVYGVPAGDDPTIGALDLLEDFFRHYPGLEYERAAITVQNGEITEVLIEYHP